MRHAGEDVEQAEMCWIHASGGRLEDKAGVLTQMIHDGAEVSQEGNVM